MSISTESYKRVTKKTGFSNRVDISVMVGTYLIFIGDLLALIASLAMVSYLLSIIISPIIAGEMPPRSIWQIAIYLLIIAAGGTYKKRLPFWHEVKNVINAMIWAFVICLVFVLFVEGQYMYYSLILTTMNFLISVFLLPLCRYSMRRVIIRHNLWMKPVIVLGDGNVSELLIKGLKKEVCMGYIPVHMSGKKAQNIDILLKNINLIGASDVFVAEAGLNKKQLREMIHILQQNSKNVILISELMASSLLEIEISYLFDDKVLLQFMHNNLSSIWNRMVKRFVDLILGLIIFIIVSPFMFLLAVIIKLDSKGPALLVQPRLGKRQHLYQCYKFRTMYKNNDEILGEYLDNNPEAREEWTKFNKLRGYDPRVTRVGRVMRKLSLDELPQLINVIKGEMSLVGPRPYLPREMEQIGIYAETILRIPPGITGLWQVSGRNGIDFEGRVAVDTWFVNNWSLWTDITILFRTISVVLSKNGAY